jgi:TonB-linked SusC/RagA family outer membrane protein
MNLNLKKATLVVTMSTVMMGVAPLTVAAETTGSMPTAPAKTGKVVRGVVSDSQGPLVGATVMEKGTSNGTVTDFDGNYKLTVSNPDAILVVKYVGYLPEELGVSDMSVVNFKLHEDGHNLNEVVVIGYGTQRREAVTGSVANVSAEKLMENPSSNITQALQNRIAGVDMQQTNSQPGAEMRIRIRGQRSLTASNDPLIVLDGIPFVGSLSDINPSDIKSLDILKDASATAIYGSRGANGVIMVTTNKGSLGTPAKVTYNGYVNFKTLFNKFPMMEGEKYVEMRKLAGKYTNGLDEKDNVNTDWQDLFFETGVSHSHDITVSGGTQTGTYSFGGSYNHDEGVIPTQAFDRFTLRANLDQKIGNYVRVGLSSTNTYNTKQGTQLGVYSALNMSPITDPYNEDGTLKRVVHLGSDDIFVLTKDVIKDNEENWRQDTNTLATYNSLFGEVEFPWLKGLKYRINLGLNFRNTQIGNFTAKGFNSVNENELSSASMENQTYKNYAVENVLSFDRTFNEKHQVSFVGLFSAEQTRYTQTHMSGRNVPDYFQYYNIGASTQDVTVNPSYNKYWQAGLLSWMGRVMYTYDNKYMISAAVRSDGSSRLAPGHQWHTYPAVSIGWNIAREKFMENIKWLDNLKIRAGYGQTANQAIDPYTTLGSLGTVMYNFGPTGFATGYSPSTLANSELGWEYSETFNYGIDFSLFNGRLSGTLEYYTMETKDVLNKVSLPGTAGVASYTANIGKTQNKGFEASLNGIIIDNKNGWTWEAGVNVSINRNKLVKLASADKNGRDEGNGWFVGYPIDVLYDYEKVGLWNSDDPDYQYLDILEPGGNEGMIKVKYTGERDETGKPVRSIGPDDRQIISLEPDFTGGFNTRVAYKNIDLNIIGAFQCGGKLISTLYGGSGYLNLLTGRRGNVDVDYWTPENKGAEFPRPGGIQSGDNQKYASTLALFDGGYLKIRNITLGYNFNSETLKKVGISSLRLYAAVQNPFIISSAYYSESGLDPEPNSMSDQGQFHATKLGGHALPVVGTNAPCTRNYLIGLNLSF